MKAPLRLWIGLPDFIIKTLQKTKAQILSCISRLDCLVRVIQIIMVFLHKGHKTAMNCRLMRFLPTRPST